MNQQDHLLLDYVKNHQLDDAIKLIKNQKVNCQVKDSDNNSLLIIGSANGVEKLVKILLEQDIDINNKNNWGDSAISKAAKNGHYNVLRLLLNQPTIDINSIDKSGSNSLHWAAANNHLQIIGLLLENNINNNIINSYNDSPINLANKHNHQQAVKMIQEFQNLDQRNNHKLSWAISNHLNDIATELINKQKPNLKDYSETTNFLQQDPLILAIECNNHQIVDCLLANKASIGAVLDRINLAPYNQAIQKIDGFILKNNWPDEAMLIHQQKAKNRAIIAITGKLYAAVTKLKPLNKQQFIDQFNLEVKNILAPDIIIKKQQELNNSAEILYDDLNKQVNDKQNNRPNVINKIIGLFSNFFEKIGLIDPIEKKAIKTELINTIENIEQQRLGVIIKSANLKLTPFKEAIINNNLISSSLINTPDRELIEQERTGFYHNKEK